MAFSSWLYYVYQLIFFLRLVLRRLLARFRRRFLFLLFHSLRLLVRGIKVATLQHEPAAITDRFLSFLSCTFVPSRSWQDSSGWLAEESAAAATAKKRLRRFEEAVSHCGKPSERMMCVVR